MKSIDKRQVILETAFKLFAEKGYHKTTIDEIAKQANVAKGLIYNYFKNKEDLLKQVAKFTFEQMSAFIPKELTDKALKEAFDVLINQIDEYEQLFTLYAMFYLQPDVREIIRPILTEFINQIVELLIPYFENKGMQNPRQYILALLAAMDGLIFHYLILKYPDFKQIANILISKFL